jgi:Zn finger protein HypA/HybF involved in hydrogenase expression
MVILLLEKTIFYEACKKCGKKLVLNSNGKKTCPKCGSTDSPKINYLLKVKNGNQTLTLFESALKKFNLPSNEYALKTFISSNNFGIAEKDVRLNCPSSHKLSHSLQYSLKFSHSLKIAQFLTNSPII